MKPRFGAWIVAAAACVACGGGAGASGPAQAAGEPSLDGPTAQKGAGGDAPAGAPSPELLAGIKAFDAGDYAGARASFEAAAKKNPRDSEALYNLGMACEKLQDRPAAEQAYKSALAAKPGLDTAAAELSALYIDENRPDDAIAVARAGLAQRPGSGALHENLGVALAAKGDKDQATRELEQAIQIAPNDPMLQLTLAHWLNVWHAGGASAHLERARELAKDDYGLVASIGHEYRMAGDFDGCIKTFDRAVTLKDGGEVRTERALCRLGAKDERGALEDLQAAVAKEPSYAPAHYYLAGRLAVGKHFKDAAHEYQRVLELEPNGSLAKPASERLELAKEADKKAGAKKK